MHTEAHMKIIERSTKAAAKHDQLKRAEHEVFGAAGGAATGALVGVIAGPPGMIAGGVVGGVVGALAAVALEREDDEQVATSRRLDEQIGVTSGDIGVPSLHTPPAVSTSTARSAKP
jgi:hypothetical protein